MQLIIKSDESPEERRQLCRELINVSAMRNSLIRNHNKKIRDSFKINWWILCLLLAELALFIMIGITGGWDTLLLLMTGILSVLCIVVITLLISLYRTLSRLSNAAGETTVLDIDEKGISLTTESGSGLRSGWPDVIFVKTYTYSVIFLGGGPNPVNFSISRKYKDEIYAYLRENVPNLLIIDL